MVQPDKQRIQHTDSSARIHIACHWRGDSAVCSGRRRHGDTDDGSMVVGSASAVRYVRACFEQTLLWSRRSGSAEVSDLAGQFDDTAVTEHGFT